MSKSKNYKGRYFRNDYQPTKAELKKSYGEIYSAEELDEIYKLLHDKETDKK